LMTPDIPLENQRPAEYVFDNHVEDFVARLEPADSIAASGAGKERGAAGGRAA